MLICMWLQSSYNCFSSREIRHQMYLVCFLLAGHPGQINIILLWKMHSIHLRSWGNLKMKQMKSLLFILTSEVLYLPHLWFMVIAVVILKPYTKASLSIENSFFQLLGYNLSFQKFPVFSDMQYIPGLELSSFHFLWSWNIEKQVLLLLKLRFSCCFFCIGIFFVIIVLFLACHFIMLWKGYQSDQLVSS